MLQPCSNHDDDSLHQHSHKFKVICCTNSIFVDFYDHRLRSSLRQAVPSLEQFFLRPSDGKSPACRVPGHVLLTNYRALKDVVDRDKDGLKLSDDDSLDLELLVDGLLEDGDVWGRLGVERLHRKGLLDDGLLSIFIHQRLMQGIQSIDTLFKRMNNRVHPITEPRDNRTGQWTDEIHELDASPASEGHFHLATWNDYRRQFDESSGSPSPDILSEDLIRQLPGHFVLENFHNDLAQEFPQLLPTVARGGNLPIVFSDELSNFHTPESFTSIDANIRKQQQIDLNMRLVAACKTGALATVNSLLGEGASPNCLIPVDGLLCTPLIAAIENGQKKVAHLLAFRGANLEDKATFESEGETLRYTALWAATRTKQQSIVQFLLERGADINGLCTIQSTGSPRRFTCMSEAARMGLSDMFQLLLMWDTSYAEGLKHTRFVNTTDSEAEQVKQFFEAIRMGSLPSFIEALRNFSNPNVLTNEGTPLSVAAQYNQPHKIKILLEHGADVQLASLYLSRSGQQQASMALVKTVFGSQDIHAKFIRQYKRLVQLYQSSHKDGWSSLKRHCNDYRQAWAVGIEVMQNICRGKTPDGPDCLHKTLCLLSVARAVAETAVGDTGEIELLDKFDTDLLRWQLLFPKREDLNQYQFAVRKLWKVNLEGSFFLDLDFHDSDTLGRFSGLISRLLDGARGPLGLSSSSYGLNDTFSRWKQRHQDERVAIPTQTTNVSAQSSYPTQDMQESEHIGLSPESRALTTSDKTMTREVLLQKTCWLDKRSKSSTGIFFLDFTGVAEDLLRGIVFSIVFVFIHGKFMMHDRRV